MGDESTRFLTPRTFGAAVGVSKTTIIRWIAAGHIAGLRLPSGHWRIAASELERIVATANPSRDRSLDRAATSAPDRVGIRS